MNYRQTSIQQTHSLLLLTGLLILLSIAYFPISSGTVLADFPEIIIPLGISLSLTIYTIRLLSREFDVSHVNRIGFYGWAGAIIGSCSAWWFIRQNSLELKPSLFANDALTVISVGSFLGVSTGTLILNETDSENQTERDRLLTETSWTNEPEPNPILTAITTQIAEIEGRDPLEIEPLYEHINPNVFLELQEQDYSQWQLLFYRDEYEIRVSGHGTVSIYEATKPVRRPKISRFTEVK